MIIELHCHTQEHSPCSRVAATELAATVRRRGADGLIITDHHYLWSDDKLQALRHESELPESFLILSGQEVLTADFGDVLVYGADRSIAPGISLFALRRNFPDAALVWAHPYRYGNLPTVVELMNSDLDAIETINPHHSETENRRAVADWQRWGYHATSGSDIHRASFEEFFPVHCDCPLATITDVVSCIKSGRIAPHLGKYA